MNFAMHGSIEKIKKKERDKRDEEAAGYIDFVEKVYGPFRSMAYTATVLHFLQLRGNQVWLDAGSGVGRLSLELASRVAKVVCVDHSSASLKELEKNARQKQLSNLETAQSDICNYPGESGHFDGILCSEVLQHVPTHKERIRGVENLYRMLKPGGHCLINVIRWRDSKGEEKEGYWGKDQDIYRNYFTREEMVLLLEEAGFKNFFIRGLDILPQRLSRFLPTEWAPVDTWLARVPLSGSWGNNILAIGVKK